MKYIIFIFTSILLSQCSNVETPGQENNNYQNNPPVVHNNDSIFSNDTLIFKLDMDRGGVISYLSLAGTDRNMINIHDEGRYIQQSYYAGNQIDRQADGQSPTWSPWWWNPIQVGDAFGNKSQVLDFQRKGNEIYVKCIPMLWDMKDRPAEAEIEQWTTLQGSALKVRNRLTCHRTDEIYGEGIPHDQELPAVYPISALKNLYFYRGKYPFINAFLTNPPVVQLSIASAGYYDEVSEHWMAFVDDDKWGIGIYNSECDRFLAGMSGEPGGEARDPSTSYISPIKKESFYKNSIYEYEYFIIIGTLNEIRNKVYQLHSNSN